MCEHPPCIERERERCSLADGVRYNGLQEIEARFTPFDANYDRRDIDRLAHTHTHWQSSLLCQSFCSKGRGVQPPLYIYTLLDSSRLFLQESMQCTAALLISSSLYAYMNYETLPASPTDRNLYIRIERTSTTHYEHIQLYTICSLVAMELQQPCSVCCPYNMS